MLLVCEDDNALASGIIPLEIVEFLYCAPPHRGFWLFLTAPSRSAFPHLLPPLPSLAPCLPFPLLSLSFFHPCILFQHPISLPTSSRRTRRCRHRQMLLSTCAIINTEANLRWKRSRKVYSIRAERKRSPVFPRRHVKRCEGSEGFDSALCASNDVAANCKFARAIDTRNIFSSTFRRSRWRLGTLLPWRPWRKELLPSGDTGLRLVKINKLVLESASPAGYIYFLCSSFLFIICRGGVLCEKNWMGSGIDHRSWECSSPRRPHERQWAWYPTANLRVRRLSAASFHTFSFFFFFPSFLPPLPTTRLHFSLPVFQKNLYFIAPISGIFSYRTGQKRWFCLALLVNGWFNEPSPTVIMSEGRFRGAWKMFYLFWVSCLWDEFGHLCCSERNIGGDEAYKNRWRIWNHRPLLALVSSLCQDKGIRSVELYLSRKYIYIYISSYT